MESVRVNVGLTRDRLEKIDELIDRRSLFNSRSEFVIAALRNLFFDYACVVSIALRDAMDECDDSKRAFERFYSKMESFGRGLDDRYKEQFGTLVNIQIAIRLNQVFYNYLASPDDLSPRGIQPLCRMAIVQYCRFIENEMDDYDAFADEYNGSADERDADEGDDDDPMRMWDDLTIKRIRCPGSRRLCVREGTIHRAPPAMSDVQERRAGSGCSGLMHPWDAVCATTFRNILGERLSVHGGYDAT